MIDIAQFIAAKAQFRLDEGTITNHLNVYVCEKGIVSIQDCTFSARIPDGDDPVGDDGWQLSGDRTLNLFGSSVLQPGQEVRVFALRQDDRECADWANISSQDTSGSAPDAGTPPTVPDAGSASPPDAGVVSAQGDAGS
ncbi:MAG: hypothetical protein GY822_01705 [Deltaproteobacteria bacterium]|nr:hypothetical protein [Deltaproteobacteria bacterium]